MRAPTNYRRLAAALLVCLGAACSGDATRSPDLGFLRVLVVTSGGDRDLDGYDIAIDSLAPRYLGPDQTIQERLLKPGPHTVTLGGVAANCSVSGSQTRSATVTTERPTEVVFEVVCVQTGVAVTTTTIGLNHPNDYRVSLDGRAVGAVNPSGSIVVGRLDPGWHAVSLSISGSTCSVSGEKQITVRVVARTVTPIDFQITCVTPIRRPKIAYQLDTVFDNAVGTAIAVVNLDGSGPELLGLGSSASWSPDGTRLMFSDAWCSSDYYYYSYGCRGGLTTIDPESWNIVRPPGGDGLSSPAWAPTGDAVAATMSGSLYTVGLDVSPPAAIPLPSGIGVGRLTWSPDGRRIAFACDLVGQPSSICVVNKDGTGFTRLAADTAPATFATDPAWSPDGKRIAFTSFRYVAVLTLNGGGVTQLTEGSEPAWSPDGSKLVFVGTGGLFTINADGSDRKQLTIGNHHAPAWRP